MSRHHSQNSRRFNKGWIFFAVLCGSAIFFHKPIILTSCKFALSVAIPQSKGRSVSYEKMEWEGNKIAISGLAVKDFRSEWRVDRIELDPHFEGLSFQPKISVAHPQILISAFGSNAKPALSFLYRSAFFAPDWEIQNGVLELPSQQRFYFSMTPALEKEELGRLTLSYDPEPILPPLLTSRLFYKEDQLRIEFQLREADLSHLLPLTAFIRPDVKREWETAVGEVDLTGEIAFSSSHQVSELHCFGATRKLALASKSIGLDIECEECRGSFSYPSSNEGSYFWDKLSAALDLQSTHCLLEAPLVKQRLGMADIEGGVKLEPGQEPQLELKGILVQGENRFPISLSGKGSIQQNDTFWSVVECDCKSPSGDVMQAVLSFCRHDADQEVVQLKIEQGTAQHMELFRAMSALPGKCIGGNAAAEMTWVFRGGECKRISLDSCHFHQLHWAFPELQTAAYIDRATVECAVQKGDRWGVDLFHIAMQGGDYLDPLYPISEASAECSIFQGIVQASHAKGKWGNLEATVDFLGPHADRLIHLTLNGNAKSTLLGWMPALKVGDYPIALDASFAKVGEDLHVVVEGELVGEPLAAELHWDLSSVYPFSWPQLRKGKVTASHLTPQSYAPFLNAFMPGIHLVGNFKCDAEISPKQLHLALSGQEILFQHPLVDIEVPALQGNSAQLTCDFETGLWKGVLPVFDGKVYHQGLQLTFENVEAKVHLDGNQVHAPTVYAECEGMALRGSVDLISHGRGEIELSFATSQIAGSAQNVAAVLRHFSPFAQFPTAIDGSFTSGEGGFVFHSGKEGPQWSVNGEFHQLGFPLNGLTQVGEGSCQISYDSSQSLFLLKKGEGKWHMLDGTALALTVPQVVLDLQKEPQLEFSVKIAEGRRELSYVEGKALKNSAAQWEVSLDSDRTHLAGAFLRVSRCIFDNAFNLLSFEMHPVFKCQDLITHAQLLQNAGLLNNAGSSAFLKDWQLEGTMHAALSSENLNKGFSFRAESRDLKVKGRPWPSFYLSGQRLGEKWLIEKFEGDGLVLKGAFVVDLNGLTFPELECAWNGIYAKGSGYLRTEQKRFACAVDQIQGDLGALGLFSELKGRLSGSGTIQGDYSDEKETAALSGTLLLSAETQAPYAARIAMAKSSKFTFSRNLGLTCEDVDLEWKTEVDREVSAHALHFDQLQYRYEKDLISMRGKTYIASQPLWALVQVDVSKEPFGIIKLFDDPKTEGLKLLFTTQKGKLFFESAQGSCYGLTCQLAKSGKRKVPLATVLTGEVGVDAATLAAILPERLKNALQKLQLGRGYRWEGDLLLWHERERGFEMRGALQGEDVELLGYRFQKMEGAIEITPDKIRVNQLQIDDPAGSIAMRKIEMVKTEGWNLEIPEVSVERLQPSRLRMKDGEQKVEKPFLIENFTLNGVQASLSDMSTLEGSGRLTFTNQEKKDFSLLDIPMDLLKNIGLDPGLLTPIAGELEVELRGDKFYLLTLSNSYSEGNRSQFYLAPSKELSYIDLDGKMHIDLKLRQEVLLKLVEPFVLTIRGTLDKPRYGLQ